MERRRPRPRRRIESRSPGKLKNPPLLAVGRLRVEVDEPDRLLLRAAARACDPRHRDRGIDAEPFAGAARHRLGHLGGDGAVLLDQLGRNAQLADLDLVRVGDDAAGDDVARSPGSRSAPRRRGRRCTTPRSPASSRARGSGRARSPPPHDRRPSRGSAPAAPTSAVLELEHAAPRRSAPPRGRRGSRSCGRRSSPRARRRRRRPPGRPARPATRRGRRSAASAAAAACPGRARGARRPPRVRAARAAAAPTAAPAARSPASRAPRRRGRARCRRGRGSWTDSGTVACLRDPLREVRVGPFHPLRDHARDTLDLRLQLRVDAHAEPGDLRHDRDRAVVVGRAEPTRRRDEIGRRRRPRRRPPRARPDRRRRRGSASARRRARAASAPGTGRSGRCARRARARCP